MQYMTCPFDLVQSSNKDLDANTSTQTVVRATHGAYMNCSTELSDIASIFPARLAQQTCKTAKSFTENADWTVS